ncbi:hypothetical protein BKA70DRAFT_1123095 [Coprinopsis sp. MPI-PUGE-AT-0042]|nr:hypothetical protein BKA70DRAFT_1123095 [Coprinopsis sp. MPI-PUGE-AT-0042]
MNAYASTSSASPSAPAASQSSSPSKRPARGRKKANAAGGDGEATGPPEKRLARFKPSCPNNIAERLARVREQTFYLLDRTGRPDNASPTSPFLKEDFKVSGSTRNVYTVTIDKLPRCSCPDSQKGNHCKHIVSSRDAHFNSSQPPTFLFTPLLTYLALSFPLLLPPLALRHVWLRDMPSTSSQPRKRMPAEGDDCPISYDSMRGVSETSLVWCEGCGNAVHKGCFTQWSNTARSNGNAVTCVWCRSKWVSPDAGAGGAGVRRTASGYLNLGGVSGVSPVRDTSSYYHGPRRGQRYLGSQYYEDN